MPHDVARLAHGRSRGRRRVGVAGIQRLVTQVVRDEDVLRRDRAPRRVRHRDRVGQERALLDLTLGRHRLGDLDERRVRFDRDLARVRALAARREVRDHQRVRAGAHVDAAGRRAVLHR